MTTGSVMKASPTVVRWVTTKWYEIVDGFQNGLIRHAVDKVANASAVHVIGYSARDDVFAQIMNKAKELLCTWWESTMAE